MDSRDWLLDGSEVPLAVGEDIFTLPPNVSNSSFWNSPNLLDFSINVEGVASLPIVQESPSHFEPVKGEDTVSDVTDAQLPNSPANSRLDALLGSPHRARGSATQGQCQRKFLNMKPAKSISKLPNRGFMPALYLGEGRARTSIQADKIKSERAFTSQKRPTDENSRQRHNQMMRENRGRFNRKFKELTNLLEKLRGTECEDKPMKNKIQILEMAMYQYAHMEGQRAKFKNELLFSPPTQPTVSSHETEVLLSAPSLQDACELVVRNMCGSMDWKYGEVWIKIDSASFFARNSDNFALSTAFVSPMNMPSTRQSLQDLARKARASRVDSSILKLAQLRHAIWTPNLSSKSRNCERAVEAVSAGVSTMLTVPIHVRKKGNGIPDAFIVLMHADDDLLSYPGGVRPYDAHSVCRLTDLASAVIQTRRMPALQ